MRTSTASPHYPRHACRHTLVSGGPASLHFFCSPSQWCKVRTCNMRKLCIPYVAYLLYYAFRLREGPLVGRSSATSKATNFAFKTHKLVSALASQPRRDSLLSVHRSPFTVPCSLFPVPCSPFLDPRSTFPVSCSAFPVLARQHQLKSSAALLA